jgi:glucosamine-6-phosphate deaminase
VTLAESTRRDNLETFPGFRDLVEVPVLGVTVGLQAILRSREVGLLLLGEAKAKVFARVLAAGDFDPAWPASIIYRCARRWIVVDEAAAATHVRPDEPG